MRQFLLLALPLALLGCNKDDASDLQHDAGQLANTATRAASNAQLVVRVNGQLAQTKGVDVNGLHIEAKAGTVTVGGHVHSQAEKDLVLKSVNEIKGVDRVVDQLRVESK